jgi:hypothetical protein
MHGRAQRIDAAMEDFPITDMRPSQRWANASLQNQWLDALAQRNGDLFAMCHVRDFVNDEATFRGLAAL